MKKFSSKRFTLVVSAFTVLSVMGLWSMAKEMEAVAVTVVGTLTAIIMWYLEKETKRESK